MNDELLDRLDKLVKVGRRPGINNRAAMLRFLIREFDFAKFGTREKDVVLCPKRRR